MANGVKIPAPLANGIIILVSVMFAANFFAIFFVPTWKPDPYIYGVFMTVIGGSYMLSKSGKNGSSSQEGGPPSA